MHVAGHSALNDIPDGVNSSYQDRAYGGAGLDILIGEHRRRPPDRLGRRVQQLPRAVLAVRHRHRQPPERPVAARVPVRALAQRRAPTRRARRTRATTPARNGEPDGELGLVTQKDHGLWQEQTGGPTDPQAGNIPGGKRDMLRGADFNDGSLQGFAVDSGVVDGLERPAAGRGRVARQGRDGRLLRRRVPADLLRDHGVDLDAEADRRLEARTSFVLFDYWSPTDFKFAGIDDSTNKMVIGHRDATGWHYDSQSPFNGSLKPDTLYDLVVDVNGTYVHGRRQRLAVVQLHVRRRGRSPTARRSALNKGLVGFGSNNSRGVIDNITRPDGAGRATLDTTKYFEDGQAEQFTGPSSGTWAQSGGRNVGTAAGERVRARPRSISGRTIRHVVRGRGRRDAEHDRRRRDRVRRLRRQRLQVRRARRRRAARRRRPRRPEARLGRRQRRSRRRSPPAPTTSLDVDAQGHRRDRLAERQRARQLRVQRGRLRTARSASSRSGAHDVGRPLRDQDQRRVLRRRSAAAARDPRSATARVAEGNSGQTPVTVTLSLTAPVAAATTVGWQTVDGSATAASGDYRRRPRHGHLRRRLVHGGGHGVSSRATRRSSRTRRSAIKLDERRLDSTSPNGTGTITIDNDDLPPLTVSVGNATVTEGNSGTSTFNVPVTLSRASTTTVTVIVTTVAGTAKAGTDFQSKTQTLTFAAGVTQPELPGRDRRRHGEGVDRDVHRRALGPDRRRDDRDGHRNRDDRRQRRRDVRRGLGACGCGPRSVADAGCAHARPRAGRGGVGRRGSPA